MRAAMADADLNFFNPASFCGIQRATVKMNNWLAAELIGNLDVAPGDPFDPASADGFEHSFLRGPATSIVLGRRFALAAVFDFVLSVDPIDEHLAMTFDHLGDSQALDDVGSDSDDFHRYDCLSTLVLRASWKYRRPLEPG